jgi:hypothetical protein
VAEEEATPPAEESAPAPQAEREAPTAEAILPEASIVEGKYSAEVEVPSRVVIVAMLTDTLVFLSTGAEAEGSEIPSAVPVDDVAPETHEVAVEAPEPMEVAAGEAATTTGEGGDGHCQSPLWRWSSAHRRSRTRSQSARRRWPKPLRVVVEGSSCWQMIWSTQQRWLGTWKRCAKPSNE